MRTSAAPTCQLGMFALVSWAAVALSVARWARSRNELSSELSIDIRTVRIGAERDEGHGQADGHRGQQHDPARQRAAVVPPPVVPLSTSRKLVPVAGVLMTP